MYTPQIKMYTWTAKIWTLKTFWVLSEGAWGMYAMLKQASVCENCGVFYHSFLALQNCAWHTYPHALSKISAKIRLT